MTIGTTTAPMMPMILETVDELDPGRKLGFNRVVAAAWAARP